MAIKSKSKPSQGTVVIRSFSYSGKPNPFVFITGYDTVNRTHALGHYENALRFDTKQAALEYVTYKERNADNPLTNKTILNNCMTVREVEKWLSSTKKVKASKSECKELKVECLLVPNNQKTDVWEMREGRPTLVETRKEPVSYFRLDTFEAITIIVDDKLISGYVSDKNSEIGRLAVSIAYRGGDNYIPQLEKSQTLSKLFDSVRYLESFKDVPRNQFCYTVDFSNIDPSIDGFEVFKHVCVELSHALSRKFKSPASTDEHVTVGENLVIMTDDETIVIINKFIYHTFENMLF